MQKQTIGFIGAGNMGAAIMKGMHKQFGDQIALYATDPDTAKVAALAEAGVTACADAKTLLATCKYVVLAVKPQVIESVLTDLASAVTADTVLISIAAGITGEFIQTRTTPCAKVVLVMPNTPLLLGEGASALAKVEPTTDAEFDFVCSWFAACGEIAVIPAKLMKEIIAVNSSSPAFIYLFTKGFLSYAEQVGLPADAAKNLFCKALIGSAKMMTDSGYTVDELIKMVSSPGGTTLAGLSALYDGKLEETVVDACTRCTKRAYELSK